MKGRRPAVDDSAVLIEGPWQHRFVDANGVRFHVVEMGSGPLILLLHGFPEFWWTWQHQIPALAEAGYRVAAVDLRGYGASDKPPDGYDVYTMASDITGLIRALGERDAVVVGHDLGGTLGFAAAGFHPRSFRRLVVLSSAHPLRQRAALAVDPRGQLSASRHLLAFQLPRYEHVVTRDDAAMVASLMRHWAGHAWRDTPEFHRYVRACRDAIQLPQAAFCALEAYRWALRNVLRVSGRRYVKLLQEPLKVPTLQLHGERDRCVLPRTAQGSGRYVAANYEWRVLKDIGHFPQLESPNLVTAEILRWCKELSPCTTRAELVQPDGMVVSRRRPEVIDRSSDDDSSRTDTGRRVLWRELGAGLGVLTPIDLDPVVHGCDAVPPNEVV
ncbi:pimeloyl-ACP methyl ester carboxylesterase [Stackebrandtia endophytica]|uniref:Pimeloyl-ACP methyl ester carboxylesterase n=1 Tax=Stackebrandtia endophytica TaxID=1496996 RepID=A0A543AZG0_9ACTN|nr:alpha/beta hydrolase [Stackebrandtia endophytica]TQL77975.1 pimeloyl-ACP methyl ester carboxylesterase [Stackebrandtia endophytica]